MAHHCHATGCTVRVRPEMFMCRRHWFSVPRKLRDSIWQAYRVGQCDDMNPSDAYCIVAREAVIAVANKEERIPDTRLYDLFLAKSSS